MFVKSMNIYIIISHYKFNNFNFSILLIDIMFGFWYSQITKAVEHLPRILNAFESKIFSEKVQIVLLRIWIVEEYSFCEFI